MASELQKKELSEKVSTLVGTKFGGDYSIAFRHYADSNGKVSKDGVKALLRDARIGSILTRWAWAGAVVAALDADGDGVISWPDFAAAFERQEGITPHQGPGDSVAFPTPLPAPRSPDVNP
jgi:hypothetical protein